MANTFTTNYTLTKSEIGANNDNWGTDLNSAFDTVDQQLVRKVDKTDMVAQTSANISFNTSNEITSGTANLFQNFRIGDKIFISGAASGANNATHTITSKTNPQTLVVSTSLATESAGNTITFYLVPKYAAVDIDGGTIDGATVATSDVTVGTGKTLDVSSGTLTLAAGQIATAALADSAVTSAKIAAGAVATADIADDAVTYAKLQNTTTANRVLGRASAGEVSEVQVETDMIADDAVEYAKMQNIATANRVLGAASADGIVSETQVATDMIAADAVTYAKMQDVTAQNRLLGSNDVGGGVVEELTPANIRTMINVEDGANEYTLPTADATTLGGVKVGNGLTMTGGDALTVNWDFTSGVFTGDDGVADSPANESAGLVPKPAHGDASAGKYLKADGVWTTPPNTTYTHPNHSGDVTSVADGANTIVANAVTTTKIIDSAVTSAKIAADAVTSAKIADDAIDSEHYTDGSIDTAHLAADAVTSAKVADDAIDSEHYAAGSIDNEHLADDAVGVAELSATGTADSSMFLRGDNTWAAPITSSFDGYGELIYAHKYTTTTRVSGNDPASDVFKSAHATTKSFTAESGYLYEICVSFQYELDSDLVYFSLSYGTSSYNRNVTVGTPHLSIIRLLDMGWESTADYHYDHMNLRGFLAWGGADTTIYPVVGIKNTSTDSDRSVDINRSVNSHQDGIYYTVKRYEGGSVTTSTGD